MSIKIKIAGINKVKEIPLIYCGKTLEEISKEVLPSSGGYSCYFQEKVIPQIEWSKIVPVEDSEIIFIPDFGDPFSIAAIITGTQIALTAGGIATLALGIALSVGMSMGIGLLVQALTPKPKKGSSESPSTVYSWDPHTTAQAGIVWPKVYGKFKGFGNIIGNYVCPNTTDKTKLDMAALIDYGYGPIKAFIDIRINGQPQSNFKNLNVETRKGLLNQIPISFFEKIRKQHHPNIEVTKSGGPLIWEIPGDSYDDIELIFRLQRINIGKNGKSNSRPYSFNIALRELPSGEWQPLVSPTVYPKSNARLDAFWHKYLLSDYATIENGKQYEVKITAITDDASAMDDSTFLALDFVTEVSNDALEYPGRALIGLSGMLSEEFTSFQDISTIIEGLIIQQWDPIEEKYILDWSDSPGDVSLDILTQPVIGGDGTVEDPWEILEYEGIDTSRINLDDIYDVVEYCATLCPDGKNSTEALVSFNGGFDSASTVWDSLLNVCRIARCIPTYTGSKIGFVIEKPVERSGILSAGNILDKSFTEDFIPRLDRVSEVEITFNDKNKNYDRQIIPVYSPTLTTYANKATWDYPGIVKRTEAWRLGRFHLAHNELLIRKISAKGDIDCLGYKIGARLGVECDIPNWGQLKTGSRGGGRIVKYIPNITVDKIQLDYNISKAVEDGETYEILIRLQNDAQILKTIQSISEDIITVTKFTGNNLPQEDDVWAIGKQNYVVKDFRLLNRKRNQEFEFDLDLIEYHEDIWDDDQSTPLVSSMYIISGKKDRELIKPVKLADLKKRESQAILDISNIDDLSTTNTSWINNTPIAGSIAWEGLDGVTPILVAYKGESYEVVAGNTNNQFIYWDIANPLVFSSTNTFGNSILDGRFLICINTSGIADPTFIRKSIFGWLIQAGTIITDSLTAKVVTADKIYDSAGLVTGLKTDTWGWTQNQTTLWKDSFCSTYNEAFLTKTIGIFYCEGTLQQWQARLGTYWKCSDSRVIGGWIRPELWLGSVCKWTGAEQSVKNTQTIFNWGPINLLDYGFNLGDTVVVKLRFRTKQMGYNAYIYVYCEGFPGDKYTAQTPYGTLLKE